MHLFVLCLCVTGLRAVAGDNGQEEVTEDDPPKEPVAATPLGPIRGSWMTSRRGRRFEAYRGIHYAQPPVGDLRFQPPKPITKYKDEVDAREDGPACPQPLYNGTFVDEDCLRLNVYTPNRKSLQPLPVLVYLHQGGFYVASARSNVVGPNYLMDRDLVLVSVNYRLASLGLFQRAISMSASPFSQMDIGFDQLDLAKKQAELVGCPTTSNKAIMDCLKTVPWNQLGDSLPGFAEFAGDPIQIWKPIVEKDFGQERFLPSHPLELLRSGKMHPMPYIISQTRNEFYWFTYKIMNNASRLETMDKEWDRVSPISFILPRNDTHSPRVLRKMYIGTGPLKNDSKTTQGLGTLYGDSLTGYPVHRLANLMCHNSKKPVYYYQFNYMGRRSFYEDPLTKKPIGVVHHDDLIYLFPVWTRFEDVGLAGPDAQMVDKMTAIFYNFARYGDPNPRGDLPEIDDMWWPPMTPEQKNYLQLGSSFSVHQNLFEDRFRIWDELFPVDYTLA